VRYGRGVAYAADELTSTETEPPQGAAKVPIWESLAAGWVFLFGRFPSISARVWVAAVVLAILDARLSVKIDAGSVDPSTTNTYLWLSLAYVALYLLVAASLYSLALGVRQKPILAGFAVGPDELRFILAIMIFAVIAIVLLIGGILVGQQVAQFVSYSGGIAELTSKSELDDLQWFKDMSLLEIITRFGPLAIAGLIALWLGFRYTFVPLHVLEVHRLAIFDGLALSKGNTWRLVLLVLLLFVALVVVALALVIGLEAASGAQLVASADDGLVTGARALGDSPLNPGHHTHNAMALPPRALPEWLASLISTVINLMAIAVGAGTLAYAYKKAARLA